MAFLQHDNSTIVKMKQITILGATSLVGKNLLQKAIDKSIKVKVLARNKKKLEEFTHVIEIIEGNYFDTNKLPYALEGSEAILSTIGPPININLSSTDEKNYINSLNFIINQMSINKQSRLLNISGAGIQMTHENLPLSRKLLRVTLKAMSKSIINIKDKELQLLEKSNLEWTSIRSPKILEKAEGKFCAHDTHFLGTTVDLNQLTDFMIGEITNNEWIRKAPVVGTK